MSSQKVEPGATDVPGPKSKSDEPIGRRCAVAAPEASQLESSERELPVRPASSVSLHIIDNEALLVDASAQALYGLNTAAAFIWCGLEEGWDFGRLSGQYAATFRCSRRAAAGDVERTLARWRAVNLLQGKRTGDVAATDAHDNVGETARSLLAPRPRTSAQTLDYKILSQRYRLSFETEEHFRKVHPVLAQFAVDESNADESAIPAATIDSAEGVIVAIDGRETDRIDGLAGLAPAVKSALVMDAVNRHGFKFFLHAAVARWGRACILLPAAPGSGKTCLSLALARAGFAYQTDEIALLDGDALNVLGVPVSPCVKDGAWPVMRGLYPEIDRAEAHHRVDGKTVKYITPPPPADNPGPDRSWPARWLVLPKYTPGTATELAVISRVEGLRRLLEECLALRTPLNAQTVGELARWVAKIECRTLTFSSLDEAVACLRGLCSKPPEHRA